MDIEKEEAGGWDYVKLSLFPGLMRVPIKRKVGKRWVSFGPFGRGVCFRRLPSIAPRFTGTLESLRTLLIYHHVIDPLVWHWNTCPVTLRLKSGDREDSSKYREKHVSVIKMEIILCRALPFEEELISQCPDRDPGTPPACLLWASPWDCPHHQDSCS